MTTRSNLSPVPPQQELEEMDFWTAFPAVRDGKRITRKGWANDDQVFRWGGYLSIKLNGQMKQLILSDGDMDATDWIVVREN